MNPQDTKIINISTDYNLENSLIHVDLDQFKDLLPNNIDWSNVSEELKEIIAHEYKRGYYDAQRRLCKDLKNISA